jgi:hypothetical protein
MPNEHKLHSGTDTDGVTDDSPPPDLLLSVPFYVYEDLAWTKATFMGGPVREFALAIYT